MSQPPHKHAEGTSTVGIVALLLGIHFLLYVGFLGRFDHAYDAPQYARLAWEISTGRFELAPHTFSNRFGVTLPTALAYAFGVNRFTTTVWPLTASLLTLAIVFFVARRFFGRLAATWCTLLLAVNPVQAKHAARLLPDLIVSMFMLAAVSVLVIARPDHSRHTQRNLGLLCAVLLFLGVLTKATVVWIAPFMAFLLARDLVQRRRTRFWCWLLGGTAAAAALLLGTYSLATGDPFYRLAGIEGTHNVRPWTFHGKDFAAYFQRLTYGPVRFVLEHTGLGMALLLALPGVAHLVKRLSFLPSGTRYWSGACAVLLVSFWFGTTSLREYNPLPLVERFLIPLLPPLSMVGGVSIAALLSARASGPGIRTASALWTGAFVIAAGVMAGVRLGTAVLYGSLGICLLALRFLVPLSRARARLSSVVLVCLVAAPGVRDALRGDAADVPPIFELERTLLEQQLDEGRPTVVLTDRHSAFSLPFRFRQDGTEFLDWNEAPDEIPPGVQLLVFVHEPRLQALKLNWGLDPPDSVNAPPPRWERLGRRSLDGRHFLTLFRIDSIEELRRRDSRQPANDR